MHAGILLQLLAVGNLTFFLLMLVCGRDRHLSEGVLKFFCNVSYLRIGTAPVVKGLFEAGRHWALLAALHFLEDRQRLELEVKQ
mgnify:CR=1 FL=1